MENKIDKNKIAFNMFSRLSEDIRDYIALYESYGKVNFSSVIELANYIKKTTERIISDTTGTKDAVSAQDEDSTDDMEACDEPSGCGYRMVDLGLPSGLKWADRNVGAERPEDYGDYFMWGSTTPDTNKSCNWAHAPFNDGASAFNETYFNEHKSEWLTEDGTLKLEYDAAHVGMGGSWRMPTLGDMQELIEGTTRSVETLGGSEGMRFTAPNGNSIFMPFCGYRDCSGVYTVGIYGYAWSSSLDADYTFGSHGLHFDDDGDARVNYFGHYFGYVVRGVHD